MYEKNRIKIKIYYFTFKTFFFFLISYKNTKLLIKYIFINIPCDNCCAFESKRIEANGFVVLIALPEVLPLSCAGESKKLSKSELFPVRLPIVSAEVAPNGFVDTKK